MPTGTDRKRRRARSAPRRLLADLLILGVAGIAALAVRALVAGVYLIPSESMLPGLMTGDYVLVEKWPYGWARARLPLGGTGRVHGRPPARGDVIVFKAPPAARRDYIKRVIGLPGDVVALRGGRLIVNGRAVPTWRIADFVTVTTPNSPCRPEPGADIRAEHLPSGAAACRTPRWREALPGGALADSLDLGPSESDAFGPVTVPAGHLFVLGDNRDRSADSRWPAGENGAVGMVPLGNVVGRAARVLFSVDGSARLSDPAGWLKAVRWARLGVGV